MEFYMGESYPAEKQEYSSYRSYHVPGWIWYNKEKMYSQAKQRKNDMIAQMKYM